ncbi:hypothetical protein ACRALDRAFT_212990 [Sodiomyces alcalophilus JCM 7366]|uniref:uncharacterized protein n=1 Tax=Sodiomyces alcalophilus JCM 7366 TaxID=591952 RepID=UPI0039B59207
MVAVGTITKCYAMTWIDTPHSPYPYLTKIPSASGLLLGTELRYDLAVVHDLCHDPGHDPSHLRPPATGWNHNMI